MGSKLAIRVVPKNMRKSWPTLNAIEMPEVPWQMMKKGIERLKKVGCTRGIQSWKAYQMIMFQGKAIGNPHVRGAQISVKSLMVALFC